MAASLEPEIQEAEDLAVLELAAEHCASTAMQTPAVMAAMARLARDIPEARDDLAAFWHALQLRRPEARRHDADVALHALRARLEP